MQAFDIGQQEAKCQYAIMDERCRSPATCVKTICTYEDSSVVRRQEHLEAVHDA